MFEYSSGENSMKQQVTLTRNAFSFLIDGKKEVITANGSLSINNTHFLSTTVGENLVVYQLPIMK